MALRSGSVLLVSLAFLIFGAVSLASAFSFATSADAMPVSTCNAGFLTLWVSGATPGTTVAFTANAGPMQSSIDRQSVVAYPDRNAPSAVVTFIPQACLAGRFAAQVSASACDATGCSTQVKTVFLDVSPCPLDHCNGAPLPVNSPVFGGDFPHDCTNGICSYYSRFQRTYYPARTVYAAEIARQQARQCVISGCAYDELVDSQPLFYSYRIHNLGAAGDFDFTVTPLDGAPLFLAPSDAVFSLGTGESHAVQLRIAAAQGAVPGIYKFQVKALHNGAVLDSRIEWVEVVSPNQGSAILQLDVPSSGLTLDGCNLPTSVPVTARLQQFTSQVTDVALAVSVNGGQVFSQVVRVAPGITAEFPLQVPAKGVMHDGPNTVSVTANSPGFAGSGSFTAFVTACSANLLVSTRTNTTGSHILITATLFNKGTDSIPNLSGALTGLPSSWSYTSSTLPFLAPNSTGELQLDVLASDDRTANPILEVLSNGKAISSQPVSSIAREGNSGLTGFAITSLSDAWFPLAVLLLALAAGLFIAGIASGSAIAGASNGGDIPPASPPSPPATPPGHSVTVKVGPSTPSANAPAVQPQATNSYLARMRALKAQLEGRGQLNMAQ